MVEINRPVIRAWLAMLFAAVIGLTGSACTRQSPSPVAKSPSTQVTRLDFDNLPNGPAPKEFGKGEITLISNPNNDPGVKFRIAAGKLTPEPTRPDRYSSYMATPKLDSPVVNLGARWTFTRRGDTDSGVAAMLITDQLLEAPLPVHLIMSPTKWSFGVWPAAKNNGDVAPLATLKRGKFDPPLKDDGKTVLSAEVWLQGDRVEVKLPDGSTSIVRDERIAKWPGRYAVFEAHAQNGLSDVQVGFVEVWAGYNPL